MLNLKVQDRLKVQTNQLVLIFLSCKCSSSFLVYSMRITKLEGDLFQADLCPLRTFLFILTQLFNLVVFIQYLLIDKSIQLKFDSYSHIFLLQRCPRLCTNIYFSNYTCSRVYYLLIEILDDPIKLINNRKLFGMKLSSLLSVGKQIY